MRTKKDYRITNNGKYVVTQYQSVARALSLMGFHYQQYGSTYSFINEPLLLEAIEMVTVIIEKRKAQVSQ